MTAAKGSDVLIKIGDGANPTESFSTIGGLRMTRLRIQQQVVANSDLASGRWRSVLEGAGQASVRIQGNGLVLNQTADEMLRQKAIGGTAANYAFFFANGDKLTGSFVVANYERNGTPREAEGFSVVMESVGAVSLTET